jgi:hypothetical protein
MNSRQCNIGFAPSTPGYPVIVRPGLRVGGSRGMPNHGGGNREIFFLMDRATAY